MFPTAYFLKNTTRYAQTRVFYYGGNLILQLFAAVTPIYRGGIEELLATVQFRGSNGNFAGKHYKSYTKSFAILFFPFISQGII